MKINIKQLILFVLIIFVLLLSQTHITKGATVTEVTYEDAQILMKIAQAEAGNQGIKGWLM